MADMVKTFVQLIDNIENIGQKSGEETKIS
jgi:hypothetical protein